MSSILTRGTSNSIRTMKAKPPTPAKQREKRLAEALKRNIALRKAAKKPDADKR